MTSSAILTRRPTPDEYFEYYDTYIRKAPVGDYFTVLDEQLNDLRTQLEAISEHDATQLHAPYTWTIKQVVGHLIDVERIFADRLLRIASGDTQPQPGMDQDLYVSNSDYAAPSLAILTSELLLCRQANMLLLRRIKPAAWDNRGTASGYPVTVRALAWMLLGHVVHHMTIVQSRMGKCG